MSLIFLRANLVRSSANYRHFHQQSLFLLRNRTSCLQFSTSNPTLNSASFSASSSASSSASRKPTRTSSASQAAKYNQYDTRRKADDTAKYPPSSSSPEKSRSKTSNPTINSPKNGGRKWDKTEDNEIIRLHKSGKTWHEIDAALNRPHTSCYYRYYTALDPNLEAWKLNNGQPNMTMTERLVYLVDVEKQSFTQIQQRRLMHEPWTTPTAYAPPEVLEAVAAAGTQGTSALEARASNKAGATANVKNDDGGIVFNRLTLSKKYADHKALQATTNLRKSAELLHKALRRSVEIYGENWKRVAEHTDELLDQWMPSTTRERLTPHKVSSEYRTLQRHGVDWGLEDDVVIARKILDLKTVKPDIWSILAKPLQENEEEQMQYWNEISLALGNHSPKQCKRRWDGLLSLTDEGKSAQSKSWHRFERFQYWMLWKHFYHQNAHQVMKDYTLGDPLELSRACSKVSFSKEISKWMRHRDKAACEKFFKSSVNVALGLGISPTQLEEYILQRRRRLQQERELQRQQGMQQPSRPNTPNSAGAAARFTLATLVKSVLSQVAEPMLSKVSTISPENERSTRGDHQQRIVRSDWTEEQIRALHEVVIQEKQGVQRSDFELDWGRIAEQLEQKFSVPKPADGVIATVSATLSPLDKPATSDTTLQWQPIFSPQQCQSCWEYLSFSAPSTTAAPLLTPPLSSASAQRSTEDEGSMNSSERTVTASRTGKDRREWSEHELLLLQQGVRKHGTLWADIRAQFLPNRNVSEIYQAWLSMSARNTVERGDGEVSHSSEGGLIADRLSEPDYVGLLSALDKVSIGGEKPAVRAQGSDVAADASDPTKSKSIEK
ncbi:hypothetical protein BGX28_005486 [Mortierella sp. GBA30]|nr:hypothetical protein BGX28_005486 [Mortierella sp. GBA30]